MHSDSRMQERRLSKLAVREERVVVEVLSGRRVVFVFGSRLQAGQVLLPNIALRYRNPAEPRTEERLELFTQRVTHLSK